MQQASLPLWWLAQCNPFTHAVELIRFALYESFSPLAALITCFYLALFMAAAIVGYDPGRGLLARRGGGGTDG
jgi:ABC-2 type transport system permease protein